MQGSCHLGMLPLLVSPRQGIILVTLTSLAGTSVFAHHICHQQCRGLRVQPLLVGVKLLENPFIYQG